MAQSETLVQPGRFGRTARRDAWWTQSLVVFLGLAAYVVYATWAALQGRHFEYGPYLSPFYSPLVFGDSPHSWFGARPAWLPVWVSPAILILWAPGGFRFTCYYYRGAYYKAFGADPPACAVAEPRLRYGGETSFPLILQNVHRFFLYLALAFIVLLSWDVWKAMWFEDAATGAKHFGIGLGTIILAANVVLLSCYTLGCHSLRHLVGGRLDRLARKPVRQKAYVCSSHLNRNHMRWAWISLCSVGFCDIYIRLCSMGIWSDWRIL